MKLRFQINEKYLALHSISGIYQKRLSGHGASKALTDFVNYALEKYPAVFDAAKCDEKPEKIISDPKSFPELSQLKKLVREDEYFTMQKQVRMYSEITEKQWRTNQRNSEAIVKQITGIDFAHRQFQVYMTHPNLRNGKYLGDGAMAWGNNERWPNYSTVYLWHEILHDHFDFNAIDHAIIELIADNELRIRLNGGDYPPFKGHEDLQGTKERLIEGWKNYVKYGGDIEAFRKTAQVILNSDGV